MMFSRIMSWFREECPHCGQKLIVADQTQLCTTKQCPDGHFILETHHILGVQLQYEEGDQQRP